MALNPIRTFMIVFLALAGVACGETQSFAQAANCDRLSTALGTLNRNSDFRALQSNILESRQLAQDLQKDESAFVRGGCQQQVNARQKLSGECRATARRILRGRDQYNQLAAKVETGQAVGQQRETILQQIARFGCDNGSNAALLQNDRQSQRSPFAEFLDSIFGGQRVIDNYGFDLFNQSTLRTVCVRTCDGYYWPISFSTVADYLPDDEAICAQQCPGAAVELYYYHNPGETPEQMVSMTGDPYSSLPTAFQYRHSFDRSCTCKAPVNYGSIQLASNDEGAQDRATIQFGGLNFPLPMRDPRRSTKAVVAQVTVVPLPRARPRRPGEGQPDVPGATPQLTATSKPGDRVIDSGERTVRIVGPDTPYVQAAAKGS